MTMTTEASSNPLNAFDASVLSVKKTSESAPKRRILIVEPAALLSGSERALLDLVSHVDPDRYDITVISTRDAPLNGQLEALGVSVVAADIGMLHRRGFLARMKAGIEMARIIRSVRPAVIHVNQSGLTAITSIARFGTGIPVISHVRLLDDAIVLSRSRSPALRPDACITISRCVADALGSAGGATSPGTASRPTVTEILDPFDAEAFTSELNVTRAEMRRKLGINDATHLVLMIGRVCRNKGQDLLLEAINRPGLENAAVAFCGGPPPDSKVELAYFDELRRRAESSGDRVKFLGNRSDVVDVVNASDVVVLPSRNEAFGRVLLEALALEKPIIASDIGGPSEIVGDNQRGFLFSADSSEDLSRVLKAVIAEPDEAARRTAVGRAWVAQSCSPVLHASRVQQLWDDVAKAVSSSE
jgi:glycosyltransferase involved in cell wall biosynthesis